MFLKKFKTPAVAVLMLVLAMVTSKGYSLAIMEATFGPNGESGIWFDPNFDQWSPSCLTSSPGINFAGADGTGAAVSQVHEFNAAISTSTSSGGYFVTESGFFSVISLSVTPEYTDSSPAQTGNPYVIQRYTVKNNTSSAISGIWFMSYMNADLFRANTFAQRVGLLNDEKAIVSILEESSINNLSIHQFQSDGTEIFYQAAMYFNNQLSGVDRFMLKGPGTISGGADAVYDEIILNGTQNFSLAQELYASGTPLEMLVSGEYAGALAFNIGILNPGESADVVVAISTQNGNFAEEYLRSLYSENFPIPEPSSFLLLIIPVLGLILKKIRK